MSRDFRVFFSPYGEVRGGSDLANIPWVLRLHALKTAWSMQTLKAHQPTRTRESAAPFASR